MAATWQFLNRNGLLYSDPEKDASNLCFGGQIGDVLLSTDACLLH